MNEETKTPEPLAAILAEMRDERIIRLDGADVTRCLLRNLADRIEEAVQRFVADDCAKCAHYHAATISLKDALDLANTIANHGITANALGNKASAAIYALCHEVRTVRREDAEIKQEVQRLRRELLNHRNAPVNAAALREALTAFVDYLTQKRIDEVWAKTTLPEPGLDRLVEQARAALAAPDRNCDRTKDEAEELFKARFGRPWTQTEDELAAFLFAPAEGVDHA